MEEYRKQLIMRRRLAYIKAFVWLLILTLLNLVKYDIVPIPVHVTQIGTQTFDPIDFWGSTYVVFAMQLYEAIQLNRMIKNKEMIREAYISESDERAIHISLLTHKTTLRIFVSVISIAGIIISFFNAFVFLIILGLLTVFYVIFLIVNSYYKKKY